MLIKHLLREADQQDRFDTTRVFYRGTDSHHGAADGAIISPRDGYRSSLTERNTVMLVSDLIAPTIPALSGWPMRRQSAFAAAHPGDAENFGEVRSIALPYNTPVGWTKGDFNDIVGAALWRLTVLFHKLCEMRDGNFLAIKAANQDLTGESLKKYIEEADRYIARDKLAKYEFDKWKDEQRNQKIAKCSTIMKWITKCLTTLVIEGELGVSKDVHQLPDTNDMEVWFYSDYMIVGSVYDGDDDDRGDW